MADKKRKTPPFNLSLHFSTKPWSGVKPETNFNEWRVRGNKTAWYFDWSWMWFGISMNNETSLREENES